MLCSHWATCHHRGCKAMRNVRYPEALLDKIVEILWPEGDRDHEWSSDEIELIADLLTKAGLRP